MRIGISTVLQHRSPEEWAQTLRELGCKSAVFPVKYTESVSVIDAYCQAAAENDLMIAEVGAWCSPLSADEQVRRRSMEKCVEQLKLADYIGARCCVNVTGSRGTVWDGYVPENFTPAFYESVVTSIQRIIDSANPVHTMYCIEPMPWMVPASPEEYGKLLADVDRKQFGVHMDMVNWMNACDRYVHQEAFMDRVYAQLGDRIRSCHLKDVHLLPQYTFQLQEVPCGQGELNLEYYAKLTNQQDPDMPVLIEHLKSEEQYRDSLRFVRNRLQAYL